MTYANTNEKLYDDIALWEKTDDKDLFLQMPEALSWTPPSGTYAPIAFTRNSGILNIRETKNLSFIKKTKLRKK